jgi:hypothetical protein
MVAVATMTRAVRQSPPTVAVTRVISRSPSGERSSRRRRDRPRSACATPRPACPGVPSAGLLFSGTEQEFVRTLLLRSGEIDPDVITEAYRAGGGGLVLARRRDRAPDGDLLAARRPALLGPGVRVDDPRPRGARRRPADRGVRRRARAHRPRSLDDPVELVSIRMSPASSATERGRSARVRRGGRGRPIRSAYFGPRGHARRSRGRAGGARGGRRPGADLRRRYDSTTVVRRAAPRLDAFGCIDIHVDRSPEPRTASPRIPSRSR